MAIDSAAKRASALSFGLVTRLAIIPDGAITQPDRQTAARSYGGILAAGGGPAAPTKLPIVKFIANVGTLLTR